MASKSKPVRKSARTPAEPPRKTPAKGRAGAAVKSRPLARPAKGEAPALQIERIKRLIRARGQALLAARARSSWLVTFRLSGSQGTRVTGSPASSATAASSVRFRPAARR